jgi:hypothetical protein
MTSEQRQTVATDDPRNRVVTEAVELVRRGCWVVPISGELKHPTAKGWPTLRLRPDELPGCLSNGTSGFGILLGLPPSNLVDVDLDSEKAVLAAKLFAGPLTDRIKGRPGNPSSHYLFQITDELPPTSLFKDPRTGEILVEILSTGRQAIMPPSRVRQDDGHVEELRWDRCGQFGPAHAADIRRWTGEVATIALLTTYWPAAGRHEARMALGAVLCRANWPEEKAIAFVKTVVQIAQPSDREACSKVNRDTRAAFAKLQRKEPVTGLPRLAELLGDDVVSAAVKWLDLNQDCSVAVPADWPDPKPIQAELRPVAAFDPDALLPDALRAWVMDEADRMPCAPDFVAAAAIVTLGAIIGARCAIKPKAKDDWLVVPNLWGGLVGLPSAKKSPAIGAALKPLDRLIAQAIEAYKAELEAFEAGKTAFEARKEALEHRIKAAAKAKGGKAENLESVIRELNEHKRSAPCTPILRRYKTNDSTCERLGELLRENPFGLLVLRDELVGLLVSWEREGREGDRAFFLESWNGVSSFDTDRIARGSISIPNLCLAILGGIQPDKLTSYLEQAANALANDGMLQRFQILVYPDHRPWEWRDRTPDNQARNRAFAIFETLAGFDAAAWGASPAGNFAKFPYFSFDPAAQEIFIEWSTDLHRVRLRAEDHPIIAQHLAKFDKLFPALALILHLVDRAATSEQGPVSAKAALRAAAWCDFLESHARRCYALLMDDGLRAALALANKVRQNKLPDGFTARDVRRNQWRSLTTDESVEAAIAWLEDEGWLRATQAGSTGPGRRTNRYFVNPKIQRMAKGCTANTAENSNSSVLAVPCPDIYGNLEEDGE